MVSVAGIIGTVAALYPLVFTGRQYVQLTLVRGRENTTACGTRDHWWRECPDTAVRAKCPWPVVSQLSSGRICATAWRAVHGLAGVVVWSW